MKRTLKRSVIETVLVRVKYKTWLVSLSIISYMEKIIKSNCLKSSVSYVLST